MKLVREWLSCCTCKGKGKGERRGESEEGEFVKCFEEIGSDN